MYLSHSKTVRFSIVLIVALLAMAALIVFQARAQVTAAIDIIADTEVVAGSHATFTLSHPNLTCIDFAAPQVAVLVWDGATHTSLSPSDCHLELWVPDDASELVFSIDYADPSGISYHGEKSFQVTSASDVSAPVDDVTTEPVRQPSSINITLNDAAVFAGERASFTLTHDQISCAEMTDTAVFVTVGFGNGAISSVPHTDCNVSINVPADVSSLQVRATAAADKLPQLSADAVGEASFPVNKVIQPSILHKSAEVVRGGDANFRVALGDTACTELVGQAVRIEMYRDGAWSVIPHSDCLFSVHVPESGDILKLRAVFFADAFPAMLPHNVQVSGQWPIAAPNASENSATDTGGSGSTSDPTVPAVELEMATTTLHGGAVFTVSAPGASGVNVSVKSLQTGETVFVVKKNDKEGAHSGTWKMKWDTTRVPDGAYVIHVSAHASEEGVSFTPLQKKVYVRNAPVTEKSDDDLSESKDSDGRPVFDPNMIRLSEVPNDAFIAIEGVYDIEIALEGGDIDPETDKVEVYLKHELSDGIEYLGEARYVSKKRQWNYRWDTRNTRNGKVLVFIKLVRAKNRVATVDQAPLYYYVHNQTVSASKVDTTKKRHAETSGDDAYAKEILQESDRIVQDLLQSIDHPVLVEDTEPKYKRREKESAPPPAFDDDHDTRNATASTSDEIDIAERKGLLQRMILLEISRAVTQRSKDRERYLDHLNEEIKRRAVVNEREYKMQVQELTQRQREVRVRVATSTRYELEQLARTFENTVKERGGPEMFLDSDGDGVSDYDEAHLYHTDPLRADTDADGFVDGAEIMGGFNPLDGAPEAVIVYDDPQKIGLVKNDLLQVRDVIPKSTSTVEGEERLEAVVIEGKGPPNSFVTLFIYSMPTVVTVKTDRDGNWVYTFDKELEDGKHVIYAAITDNAGRIYAKSAPLPFVKEAAAVTQLEPAFLDTQDVAPSYIEGRSRYLLIILLASSLFAAVIIIGLRRARTSSDETNRQRDGVAGDR